MTGAPVGTVLTGGPPHRPERAGLPHSVLTLGTNGKALGRVGVKDAGWRQPLLGQPIHSLPGRVVRLAATAERLEPVPRDLIVELLDGFEVAGHGVVRVVPSHHPSQPAPHLRDGQMHSPDEFGLDLLQLGSHLLRTRLPLQRKALSVPGLPADMREAEELERLRLTESSLLPPPNSISRVFSAFSSRPNLAKRWLSSARNL